MQMEANELLSPDARAVGSKDLSRRGEGVRSVWSSPQLKETG